MSCPARWGRSEEGIGTAYDQLPLHRRVSWDAGYRSNDRRRGDAHSCACGRKPGGSQGWLPAARVHARGPVHGGGARGETLMARARGASQAAYRVYGEDEYLAGAGALAEWGTPPARGVLRERRLRRLAGAAALTGAVGTVGGAIAVASIGSRSEALHIPAVGAPPARAVLATAGSGGPARVRAAAPQRRPRPARPSSAAARRSGASDRSAAHRRAAASTPNRSASVRRQALSSTLSASAESVGSRSPAGSDAVSSASTATARPARDAPAQAAGRPSQQREFGFER
jgi:hypothetical protein